MYKLSHSLNTRRQNPQRPVLEISSAEEFEEGIKLVLELELAPKLN